MANSRFGLVKDVEVSASVLASGTFAPTVATKKSVLDILAVKYAALPSGNTVIRWNSGVFTTILFTIAPTALAADYSVTLTDKILIPKTGRLEVVLSDQAASCYYHTSRAE